MTLIEKAAALKQNLQGDLNVWSVGVGDTKGKDDFFAIYLHEKAYPDTFMDVRVVVRENASPAPIGGSV
jgi:hypothetical protein